MAVSALKLRLLALVLIVIAALWAQTVPVSTSYTGSRLKQLSGGVYTLNGTPKSLAVYRNGLRMAQGVDYNVTGTQIKPIQPWNAADIVLADYSL